MNEAEILVSGATGRTGGFAIDELLKMGKRVRAYVRTDDDRAAALRQRGVDVAVGDFTDIDDIHFAQLTSSDVVRHRLVSEIVDAYSRHEGQPDLVNRAQRRSSAGRPRR